MKKFLKVFFKLILLLLIVGTVLFEAFILKFQGTTLQDLWAIATGGDFIMLMLIVFALPYVLAYLLLWHLWKGVLLVIVAGVGILCCLLSMIKSHKVYKFIMLFAIIAIVGFTIFAMINLQSIEQVANSALNSSNA